MKAALTASENAECQHCGSQLDGGGNDGFCCLGCKAAYAVITESGLGSFYDRMVKQAGSRRLKPDTIPAERQDLLFNVRAEGEECALHLMVDGLHCAACVWLIETMLSRQPEIVAARVNYGTSRLKLRWRGEVERANHLVTLIESLGFRLMPFDPAKLATDGDKTAKELLRCLAVAGFAAANVMLLSVSVWAGHSTGMGPQTRDLLHWLSALIALPAIFYAGRPFFRSAGSALRAGRTNMEVPISIGVLLAAAMSLSETVRHGPYAYFDSAVTLLFFLLIGRVLDHRARGKTRETAAHLLTLSATGASRLGEDGQIERIPLSLLAAGDRLLVAAGEKIAADGPVIQGSSEIDTSLVTGESLPQRAQIGSRLFAGMVNLSAPLTLQVEAVGENTLLAEIVRLMEAAEGGRARYRRLADRLSRLYAPVVHVAALGTFFYWLSAGWQIALLRAVSVLIITCPCALGLAIPAVQVVASGRLLKRGILLKSATALERLAEVDHVAFDKTGTLTLGEPRLEIGAGDAKALHLAAGMARASRHPLSRALAAACPVAPLVAEVEEIPGCGLRAGGNRLGSRRWLGIPENQLMGAELWLERPGRPLHRFAFAETLRPHAGEVLRWLKRRRLPATLLSGDRPRTVAAIAAAAGFEHWQGGLDPVGKVARLKALKALGHHVLMVGDGLNDAPALAAADVSASPASAADIAQNAADIVFQGQSLAPIADLLATARQARSVVRQNLAFALLYNLAAVPLAVGGLVTPALAAALMSSSSILVVLNALRLRSGKPEIA